MFFPVNTYVGLDKSVEALRAGLSRFPDDIGIMCDITVVNLPEGCADMVLSSNTLHWIADPEKRLDAVRMLAKVVRPDGKLIVEMPNDGCAQDALRLLSTAFDGVTEEYIGNRMSVWYDRLISDKKSGAACGLAHTFPLRLLSMLLCMYETCRYAPHKKHALFICERKRSTVVGEFNPDALFERVGPNLYAERNLQS